MEQITEQDTFYMKRCLELAKMGQGHTLSNPMVGSVIVCDGKIIGEGYHQKFGDNHAEVNAINSVKDKGLLKISTIYVNLEPCSHHGKTPPCSNLIIENKIPRIIIGAADTNEKVGGKGIKRLKDAGVEVKVGVLEKECWELNKRFYTFHEKQRPYVILKWAQTQDGFIDKLRATSEKPHINWITTKTSRMLVHKWRSEEMGIMVGKNTVEKDNPSLTLRDWEGNQPTRVILDRNLLLKRDKAIFDKSVRTFVFNYKLDKEEENIEFIKIHSEDNILREILDNLHRKGIVSLFVEGGTFLLQKFIESDFWDEARVFVGNKIFLDGLKAPVIGKEPFRKQNINNDKLLIYRRE